MASRLPDFHIAKIRPPQPKGMSVFATIGAWRATGELDHGLEFIAVARSKTAAVLKHLAMTAYYHAGPPENRLGVGHTVSIGEGWVDGSPLDSLLVALPYLWGPKLEHCQLPDRHIQVVWLIPIDEAERAYIRIHGADALEHRFEESSFDYLDPLDLLLCPRSRPADPPAILRQHAIAVDLGGTIRTWTLISLR